MIEIILSILSNPQNIQIAISIFLLIVTVFYVVLTWKLVHTPHTAYIQPIELKPFNGGNWKIIVINFGPGAAMNVHVFIRVHKKVTFAPTDKKPKRVFTIVDWVEAKGESEIEKNEVGSYEFNGIVGQNAPIKIRWQFVTGKSKRRIWFFLIDFDSKFISSSFHRTKFYIVRALETFRSPYYRFCKYRYEKKLKPNQLIQ